MEKNGRENTGIGDEWRTSETRRHRDVLNVVVTVKQGEDKICGGNEWHIEEVRRQSKDRVAVEKRRSAKAWIEHKRNGIVWNVSETESRHKDKRCFGIE